MLARGDCRHELANVLAIFDDRVPLTEVDQGHLVADGHVLPGNECEIGIILCDDAEHFVALLELFDNNHADVVALVVNQKLWCGHLRDPLLVHGQVLPAATTLRPDLRFMSYIRYINPSNSAIPEVRDNQRIMETNRSIASIPDFQPLYKQVYAVLIRRIADGDWRPGEAMPSEQALAAELGVSQGTVRKAMDALASQNLIVRRQGKGSFVAEHTQEHALYRFFRLARPAPSRERVTPQLGAASIKRRAANRAEQSTLQLSEKAEIVEIRRTRLVDQVPSIVEKIVLPLALFPDIESYNSLPNTLYSLYQGAYGLSVAFVKEALRAVIANKRDAKALQIEVGTPLLQIDRVAFGLDGQQIEWRVSRCDTSNIVYAVDVT